VHTCFDMLTRHSRELSVSSFHLLEIDTIDFHKVKQIHSSSRRPRSSSGFLDTTKERVYNLMKTYSRDVPKFSGILPIYLLGRFYLLSTNATHPLSHTDGALREFMRDYTSQIWITYRHSFPTALGNTSITSDLGWGCTIRSGQMMLARVWLNLFSGRDSIAVSNSDNTRSMIVQWFFDQPGQLFSYSIHNFMEEAKLFGLQPGDWFTPSAVSKILQSLVLKFHPNSLRVYVCDSGVIYKDEIQQRFPHSKSNQAPFRPILFMVPVRLGEETIQECYYPFIRYFLAYKLSVGIIGGRKGSSYYLLGFQENNIFYLDPHYIHPSPQSANDLSMYSCTIPSVVPVSDLDPSMAFGILCSTEKEVEHFFSSIESLNLNFSDCFLNVADSKQEQKM